jgi:hypothetical protein
MPNRHSQLSSAYSSSLRERGAQSSKMRIVGSRASAHALLRQENFRLRKQLVDLLLEQQLLREHLGPNSLSKSLSKSLSRSLAQEARS